MDDEVWVGPYTLLEAVDVIVQDVFAGIQAGGCSAKLRIILLRALEQFNGETGKDNVPSIHLYGETSTLVDLLGD